MKVDEVLGGAQDAMSSKRVFGDPVEKDGITVIPVARVAGGGGGGTDNQEQGGGGFGLISKPVGALIIKNGNVSWQPALDVNRLILGCQVVGAIAILASAVVKLRR